MHLLQEVIAHRQVGVGGGPSGPPRGGGEGAVQAAFAASSLERRVAEEECEAAGPCLTLGNSKICEPFGLPALRLSRFPAQKRGLLGTQGRSMGGVPFGGRLGPLRGV